MCEDDSDVFSLRVYYVHFENISLDVTSFACVFVLPVWEIVQI